MTRYIMPPELKGLLILLWILFFGGLGLFGWYLGPADPPVWP